MKDLWEHRNDPDVAVLILAGVFGLGMVLFALLGVLGVFGS
jgi:hypothetical protein